MKIFINFLKGIVGGIGNIIPGLSGSALLVIMGIYKDSIDAISNIFKHFKKNFCYLLPIGLGILIGTFAFSNIIEICLDKFAIATSIVFVGFMIGTLPSLFKEAAKEKFKKIYLIPLIITFLIGLSFLLIKNNSNIVTLNPSFYNLIIVGLLIAASTIIPGISSTVLLTMIGMYDLYINSINTLNIKILIPIFIGLAIGAFFLSKLISYLLKKYYSYTFYAIIGFVIATIPALIRTPIIFSKDLIIGIILGIGACLLTIYVSNKSNHLQ